MKLKVLAIALGLMLAFTGCAAKDNGATTTPQEPTEQTGDKNTTEEALNGTFKREMLADKNKGDVIVTEITFENGNPVDLAMDVIMEDGKSKTEASRAGEYVMVEGGTPWGDQLEAVVEFIKENNFDLSKVTYTNDKGNTDVVSGVSMKVASYVNSVEALLTEAKAGKIAEGFTGAKVGEVAGEKDTVVATVMFEHGTPVNVKFDTLIGGTDSKYKAAKDGEYVMVEGGMPWNEQVDGLAAFIVENNFDLSKVTLTTDNGNTDVVSGVSIKVGELLQAVEAALN